MITVRKEADFVICLVLLGYRNLIKTLRKIIKCYIGKNVENKIREDVSNLFEDVYAERFDGVSFDEKRDLLDFVASLGEVYPEELSRTRIKAISKKKIYNKK